MNLIPIPIQIGALALAVAAAVGYHFWSNSQAYDAGAKSVQDKWNEATSKQTVDVAVKNADSAQKSGQLQQTKAEVVNEIFVSQSTNADRGRASIERLRNLAVAKPAACTAVPQSAGASQADHAAPVAARLSDDDRRSLIEIGVKANDVRDQLYGCRKLLHEAWLMTN